MKTKITMIIMGLAVVSTGAFLVNQALAGDFGQRMGFKGPDPEFLAEKLNMTVEEVEMAIEERTLPEIMKEQGIGPERRQGRNRMLEEKAEILGMSVEELEIALESQTFHELFEEEGVDCETIKEKMREKAMQRWQEMGLSEEEIQERLEWQEQRQGECEENCALRAFGGMGRRHMQRLPE